MTKTELLEDKSIKQIEINRISEQDCLPLLDEIAVEEPLEIKARYHEGEALLEQNIAVTMRTPGHDQELALGFLFTEGIISDIRQTADVSHRDAACSRTAGNTIVVEFTPGFAPQLAKADRNFYTTSSCGVCGKGSIASIRTVNNFATLKKQAQVMQRDTLFELPAKLKSAQDNFSSTGGIHASGLFDLEGNLLMLREDVGRHNALDKLIGCAVRSGLVPLNNKILLLSGRASFELIQKAAMAGISTVAAIGAPSSLAVDLAKEFDITLLGFLRENRFNIYHSGSHFKLIETHEN